MPQFTQTPDKAVWSLERLAALLIVGLIAWFYLWTVDPEGKFHAFSREGGGYYNLLTRGFLKGHLSLDQQADPVLATLKNPYDSIARGGRGLHDASYFKGRYYLYFGVTPVVVLFAPIRLFTGWFVEERFASLIFALVGFSLSIATVGRIRRHWFARAPMWSALAAIVALGLATMIPVILRRPSVWEVPISCAYALFMLALYGVLRALESECSRWWMALASVAMGLCVGARPVYLFGALVLVVPVTALATGVFWRKSEWWRAVVCALGPIAMVGVGLAAYNFFRFGSVVEFGWTYQLAGDDNSAGKLFSSGLVAFNLHLYLLSAAGLSPYFPFVTVIAPPAVPTGQLGMENPYGLLPNLPWVALAALSLWVMVAPRAVEGGRPLRWFCAGAWLSSGLTLLTVCSFRGAAGRYLVDFAPTFVLLGGIGALWLVANGPNCWRAVAATGVIFLLGWSAAFGVAVSLQHNELLRAEHAAIYARVAHAFNRVADFFRPVRDTDVGPVELQLVFPRDAVGQVEPLVATGHEFRSDYVFVHYLTEDTVRFGFEHTSLGGANGPPIKVVPGEPYAVRIAMGSLYPPRAHPFFDSLDAVDARARARTLRVWLNGRVVLQRSLEFFDAAEKTPSIGTSGGRPGFKRDFSGRLIGWKRVSESPPKPPAVEMGSLRVRLRFPAFSGRRVEPLLSTGETGKGDLIYLTYLDAHHISFGHDHWGRGGAQSAAVEVDLGIEHTIELTCAPLLGPRAPAGLELRLDGREVFVTDEVFHPCEPDTISVGANAIQASTAGMFFSGEILASERMQP